MKTRLAWFFTFVSAVFVVADTVVIAASRPLLSEDTIAVHGWPFVIVADFSCTVIGALIVSRHPRHPVGWLLCIIGVGSSTSVLAEAFSIWMLDEGGHGPSDVGHIAAWISVLLGGQAALVALAVVFLLAPNGHFLSPRWRAVAWAGVAAVAIFTVGLMNVPPTEFSLEGDPYAHRTLAALLTSIGFQLMAVVVVASVASMVIRLRRADGELAKQMRLFAATAASVAFGLAWLIIVEFFNGGEQTWLASLPLFTAYILLSIGIGMAVLRYRLYDLDVIINRGVVLACGTIFAAVAYTVLVVGVSAAASSGATSIWPSFVTTVIVAIAFQPLRQRVVRLADRIAYGSRAAPYEALADFSRRLSGALPGTNSLLPAVAEAAVEAVSAKAVTARLIVPNSADLVARRPVMDPDLPASDDAIDIAVVNCGETLGSIAVEMPQGRSLRAQDRLLLVDLANQTSMAFRNTQLTAELIVRLDMVDRRTAELSRSRARIIEARNAERARLDHAIRRDVMPYLERVPTELAGVDCRAGNEEAIHVVRGLIDGSHTALAALREISRGVFPAQLARAGLGPAVAAQLGRSRRSGLLTVDESAAGRRFDQRTEAAAYFCFVEVLPELQEPVEVHLASRHGTLRLQLSGASSAGTVDLQGMQDRLEPIGGTVTWTSIGDRTSLSLVIPPPRLDPSPSVSLR